jgi:HEAT repeat protein
MAAGVLLLALAPRQGGAQDVDSFIKRIKDPGERVRREAWEGAASVGPAAIPALACVMAGDNRDAALAASNALARIVHACAAPGAACRKAAAGGLTGLLADGKIPVKVKLTALDLLGSVGDDESVASAARALQDPETQDFARKALERIPGDAAARALMDALGSARGDFRTALVYSLGKKRSRSAVPLLKSLAAAEGDPVRIAAAEALARIGDADALPAIKAALGTATPRARRELLDASLVMADGLARSGDANAARKIYLDVALGPAEDGQKCAALHALAAAGPPGRDLQVFLAALEDGSACVRAQAIDILTRLEGDETSEAIAERFTAAKGAQRAMLLRAMAARKDAGLEKALAEASADADMEVKVIALDLAGKLQDPSNESFLLAAMEKGSPAVRGVACAAYLTLADGVVKKDPREAARMYSRILDYSRDLDEQGRALLGLAEAADPASLPRIEAARRNEALSRDANEAYVTFAMALARSGKKDEAVAMLLSVAGSGAGRDVVAKAVKGLKALGTDPTQAQKKLGLLSSWWIVGPFPNDGGQGFAKVYSPEEEVRLDGQKDHRGRTRRWVEVHSTSPEGVMDLLQSFQRTQNVCAYAYTELDLKEGRDVKLKMGSDDGIICWLNGKKVHSVDAIRALRADEDSVPVRLEAGKNKVLLKVTQSEGEWQFSLRITDRNDQPLDLTALGK